MSMDKKTKRSIMNCLGYLKLPDTQALQFIKNLADNQMFKSPRAYEAFCTDCGIFYTSSVYVISYKMKALSDDEYHSWSEEFIEKCSYFKMVSLGFG
ncbi:hypothetical protein VPH166E361_0113 [Vibrio phage 166E36-1]